MPGDKKPLEVLARETRELANQLFSTENPRLACRGRQTVVADDGTERTISCIMAEDERPLTAAEKKQDWVHRPFWAYNTSKMCPSCEAYYHAERCAQILHEQWCWEQRIAAEEKRKAQDAQKKSE